ncbi:MAG: hypothetical protein GWN07_10900, partial [Actinobacteria bacterium]|nr:hypothetical protein [Actinomycetota bacterium]NIS30810.1 hypothetical protein [Actinomycetota bacterium]NIU66008.1 hypothetical protein [Actinomycetota bacterium]NIW27812.1 hypothetical protein [Actinomycetota bacterium]NIX20307.1 hypothetical protein [Actinomycetota bacterium]
SGDGAGLLTQIPRDLFYAHAIELGHSAVDPADLGVAFVFLSTDADERARAREAVEDACAAEDIEVLGWRSVPTDPDAIGEIARSGMPHLTQAILRRPADSD